MSESQAVTGNEFYRTITSEVVDFVMRDVTCVDASVNTQQFRRMPKLPGNAAGPVGRIAAVRLPQDRGLANRRAAVNVCRGFDCEAPVTEVEALRAQFEQP